MGQLLQNPVFIEAFTGGLAGALIVMVLSRLLKVFVRSHETRRNRGSTPVERYGALRIKETGSVPIEDFELVSEVREEMEQARRRRD